MTNTSQPEAGKSSPKPAGRQQVPFVRVLDSDNLSECPQDRNFLIHMAADLAYSRDFHGGSVVSCPVMLRLCPACRKWYIDPQTLIAISKKGVNLRGFDIIGSDVHPRPDAYRLWHPEAIAPVVVVPPVPPAGSRKTAPERQRAKAAPAVRSADKNLAFRCRYCDGGQSGRSLGFRGACSQAGYFQNVVEAKDAWCASPENTCQSQPAEQAGPDNRRCCESRLLIDWVCGPKAGQDGQPLRAVPISGNRTGSIALMTTVLPRESEANRRIFAIFQIAGQSETDGHAYVTADPKMRFELMQDEPLYFWKFFQGKGQSDDNRWDGDPCRNISQDMIIRILSKAVRVIKDPDRRAVAEFLFNRVSATVSPDHLKKLLA